MSGLLDEVLTAHGGLVRSQDGQYPAYGPALLDQHVVNERYRGGGIET